MKEEYHYFIFLFSFLFLFIFLSVLHIPFIFSSYLFFLNFPYLSSR